MLSRTNWCVKNKKKKSDLSLVVIITYPSENAATIDRGCNQDGICASGHRKELSAFLLRCKRKHSWWVVNCYRQNTTTRSTCIFSRKASRAHCGPTLFLSLFPFFFFVLLSVVHWWSVQQLMLHVWALTEFSRGSNSRFQILVTCTVMNETRR